MKVVIDARMLYWTGVGRYIEALLTELPQLDHDNEYAVLVRRADWDLWEPAAANFTKVECNIDPYSVGEQLRLGGRIKALGPDLVHFTAPNTPLLYRGPRVVTVHDLTLLDYDTSRGQGVVKFLRGLKRLPFRLVLANDAWFADRIVTATDYVKQQLVRRYHIRAKRVVTTLLAADPVAAEPEPVEAYGATGDYLFYVGNVYPYKNAGAMIEAFSLIAKQFPRLKLIVAGARDYFSEQLEQQAHDAGLDGRVVFAGRVSDAEKAALYRGAKLYINPSLSEGFGLQGLEAMAQGTPVLAANVSCLPEVYGDAAVYFDPHDPKDQAEKIGDLLGNEGLREKLRQAGYARVKRFSWRRTAEETLGVYREVLERVHRR